MAVTFLQRRTPAQVKALIRGFKPDYREQWREWLKCCKPETEFKEQAEIMRATLRRWRALGRIPETQMASVGAFKELIRSSQPTLNSLLQFDVRDLARNANRTGLRKDLCTLWELSGQVALDPENVHLVGRSKTIMLLTLGRFGPAFDGTVCENLYGGRFPAGAIRSCEIWLAALTEVAQDITAFEEKYGISLTDLGGDGTPRGRLYDMAAGPRAGTQE